MNSMLCWEVRLWATAQGQLGIETELETPENKTYMELLISFFFSSFFFQAQHRYDLKNTVYDLHIFGQN